MKLKKVFEGFPGQPEDKDILAATDAPFKKANEEHDERMKEAEEAFDANKEAVDLVSGDETKKKDGEVKSPELKKMHLSESIFEDLFDINESEENHSDEELIDKVCDILNADFWPGSTRGQAEEIIDLVRYWDQGIFNESKQVNEDANSGTSWNKVYKIFNAIVDVYFPDEDRISKEVDELYNKHKGEAAWDEAYYRWNDSSKEYMNENIDFFHETQHLDEDAGDDFLDKINKQILNVNEDLELNEENDVKSAYDIANDIIEEYPKDVDIYNHTPTGSIDDYYKIEFLVDGDWKHDHLAFKYWMNNNAAEISGCEVKYGGETPIEESDDDVYKAVHTYFFIPEKQEIQEPEIEEPQQQEEENMEEIGFDDESIVAESLKFQIAKEQLKRFNEGKMPSNWLPDKYLENLVKRNHLTEEQKNVLTEAFLK